MTADSAPLQPIYRFTVSLTVSRPPRSYRSACRFICVCRVVPVRVSSFPVGSFGERDSSGWSRVRSAAVVLRGFVV